jgi:hypothetical protein
MAIDLTKTLSLIRGGLIDHESTWKSYLDENPPWQQTTAVLTGPLILANVLLSVILARIIGGYSYLAFHGSFLTATFWGLVMAVVGLLIAVSVFNFLAGVFNGTSDFNRAYAAVSLAAIPAWVAGVVAALIPYLGFLLALAGGILSLVFMYKIMPQALNIPQDKRVVHFIASVLAIIIINAVIHSILGPGGMGRGVGQGDLSRAATDSRSTTGSGMLGEMERQGRLMEEATADIYDPPSDGELSKQQVEQYLSVMKKTRLIQQEHAEKLQKISEEMEAKEKAGESPSPAELTNMYAGLGGVMSVNNAEMEVVKTGGGNWAEHLWVKEQLRIARFQRGDGTDAMAHNYELYQEYEDELSAY